MKCGAENNTASVAIMVKSVKIIRHKRSTTIAANFQSRVMSPVSSSFLSCAFGITISSMLLFLDFPWLTWSVIQRSSFSISANSYSADEPRQVWDMASCMRASPTAATGPTGPTGPTLPSSPCLWEELSESINQSISQFVVQSSIECNSNNTYIA